MVELDVVAALSDTAGLDSSILAHAGTERTELLKALGGTGVTRLFRRIVGKKK